jgi:RNA polymerase sigma-B factor
MTDATDGRSPPDDSSELDVERAEERALFARYLSAPTPALEDLIVDKYRPLVYRIVHRFRYSPDQFEDLVQVGTVGLLLAIRRFDLAFNFRFSTYAWQTIQGEIQRYFRDKTWAVNVPRELKEKSLKVFNILNELTHAIGHEPTVGELAGRTGLSEEEVQEAMELGSAYHPQSFLDNVRDSDASFTLSEEPTDTESMDMGATKRSVFWRSVLTQLSGTEAQVVQLYFFEQLTQKEIAERMCTSQMNVSRLMRKALGRLRGIILPEDVENLAQL